MMETNPVSGTFQSPLLTPRCGVEVTITFTGSQKVLTFPHRPVGPRDLTIFNAEWVATAGDNRVRFRNVSIDLVQVKPDGTVISNFASHQPVEFTGQVKTNLDTGEVILEAHHFADLDRMCELLTA
jgi:hypothetical protein